MEEPKRINDAAELQKLIDEKGKLWLVAAMVEGSIGYHTPKHAEILIEKALSGKTVDWCERCDACFKRDLFEMINYDIRHMLFLGDRNAAKANRLVETVKVISTMDSEAQLSVSLAYPTMSI
jgi:hypothetical protein